MKHYKHLTKTNRLQIEAYLKIKMPIKQIAKNLQVHISTIYREIKRGECEQLDYELRKYKTYSSDLAELKYRDNLKAKGPDLKIGNDFELVNYIENKIVNEKLSPLAVIGEIKFKKLEFKTTITINTLYSYIEKGVFEKLTIKHLPMKSKEKKKRRNVTIKKAPRGKSIELRPQEINDRKTFGHWEMDCVCGSTLDTLLVLTERLTRKEIIFKMNNQKSETVIKCINKLERKYGKYFRKIFKTITVDNGSEFNDFKALEKSIYGRSKRFDLFYCHPYSSYERGTNERINREIRRLIPKGSDLSKYSEEDIQRVEDWVNNYPRQVLGFNTSINLYNQYVNLI